MDSVLFPTTIVDNFLDQPFKYIDLANRLNYSPDPYGNWPGLRSENLSNLYPEMINRIIGKIASQFYNFENDQDYLEWTSMSFFQKVSSNYKTGWTHLDTTQLTCLIYFCREGFGTSLYNIKDIETYSNLIHTEEKEKSYKNVSNIDQYDNFKEKNNSQFVKSITVDSAFNRLLTFESDTYHAADNFCNDLEDQERLTLILFISDLKSKKFPIQRCKRG